MCPPSRRGGNHDEIGKIVKFGIAFQPVTHSGRYIDFDPMDRETLADVIHGIAEQTDGIFVESDFTPVPCSTSPAARRHTPTSRTAT